MSSQLLLTVFVEQLMLKTFITVQSPSISLQWLTKEKFDMSSYISVHRVDYSMLPA